MTATVPLPFSRGIDLASDAFGNQKMYGLHVAYIGSEDSHTVEVEADGDLVFKHGDAGSEAVDSTVGASGVIDVSTAPYDTIGEVVAEINSSANWLASYASLPPSFSSNDTLATRAAASVGTGTLLEVDDAQLGTLQSSKITLSRGLGLEDATDLLTDLHLRDRLTHPLGIRKSPSILHGFKKQIVIDSIRSQVTGTGWTAADTTFKIVRVRYNPHTFAETEETVRVLSSVASGVQASGTITFADNPTVSVAASGTITFADNPTADVDTITLNGVVWSFTTAASGTTNTQVAGDLATTLTNLATQLNASVNASLTVATYTENGTVLTVTYDTEGTAGNAYTLAASADTPSGANLTGGVAADTITLNGQAFGFTTAASTTTTIQGKATLSLTLDEMVTVLNASVIAGVALATYTKTGTTILTITYDIAGTVGNAFTLAASADTVSAATLENGAEGTELFIPNNSGGRSPIVYGNPGELLFFVVETTDTDLPETVDITLTGYINPYAAIAAA